MLREDRTKPILQSELRPAGTFCGPKPYGTQNPKGSRTLQGSEYRVSPGTKNPTHIWQSPKRTCVEELVGEPAHLQLLYTE